MLDALNSRERIILGLVAAGHRNRVIAATLHMGLTTVEGHLARIRRKTHISHRVELARLQVTGSMPSFPGAEIPALTPRENEVARLRVTGMSYSQIGRALAISEKTVSTHLEHIHRKLRVTNVAGLGAYYARLDRERVCA